MSLLDQLRASRDSIQATLEETLKGVEARVATWTDNKTNAEKLEGEARASALTALGPIPDLTVEERATFDGQVADAQALDVRIAELEVVETGRAAAAAGARRAAPAVVRSEPLTYNKHEQSRSYFKDLTALATRGNGMGEAQQRLERHAQEMDVELPRRAARRDANAETEARNAIGWDAPNPFEKRTNPNRTDGTGGYLVPPVWLMDDLIPILRAGRVVADRVRKMDLPTGTDSINIPKLATGTTAAVQTADAAAVSSTDFTDTSVSAGVKTIAGQEDVSVQLIEQSPLNLDQVIFADLVADYNKKLDVQVLAGANANGEVKGLYSSAGASPWSSYNQVSYTDASPTAAELYSPLAASLSKIEQTRFDLEHVEFFMHSRRWFWMTAAVDGNGRPLVLPDTSPRFNTLADASAPSSPPGYKGMLSLGFPVFTDPNITTTDNADGGGATRDIVLALKTDDAYLFEGEMRQRTLPEILSGTLQVRFQIYNYVAFLLRYDQALAIVSGTGLTPPSGF